MYYTYLDLNMNIKIVQNTINRFKYIQALK